MSTTAPYRPLRVLTNSELRTHRRCHAEHHFSYELGYRAAVEGAAALHFGTAIHLALEAWWSAPRDERLARALVALPVETLDAFELVRATEMLRGYDLRWCGEPYEAMFVCTDPADNARAVPLVEAEFRAPLINPSSGLASRTFVLGGKLDALARNTEDGRVYIVEHKTSSDNIQPGSQYWQLLRLDTQVSTYYAGARALGFEPAGVLYDVIGKPKQRPFEATPTDKRRFTKGGALIGTQRAEVESPSEYALRVREAIADDPDRYFVRGTVVRLEREERDAQWDAWQHARLIREAELEQRWPRNPDNCKRFGRMCSYFDICTGAARLDDTTRFRHTDNVHEELTTPPETTTDDATTSDSSNTDQPADNTNTNDTH